MPGDARKFRKFSCFRLEVCTLPLFLSVRDEKYTAQGQRTNERTNLFRRLG